MTGAAHRPGPAEIARVAAALAAAGGDAQAEAEELCLCTGSLEAALALAARRAAGEPLAYLTGRARFMDLWLAAGPGALVPRAETELLGAAAVDFLGAREPEGRGLVLLDLCCGSGNLVCGIAHRLRSLRAAACDLTRAAVALARVNVERHGLSARVEVRQGDLFAALDGLGLEGGVDLIVCNPPYISTKRLAGDRAALLSYEPREAFDGGAYGLSIHQRVVREAPRFLRPGGALAFEVGAGQERQVEMLLARSGGWKTPVLHRDAAGLARVVEVARSPSVEAPPGETP